MKRIEKEQLNKLKENKEIDLKEFLIKKKEIDEWIFHYDYSLKNSRFEDLGKN
ncbi:hypothetical protein [Emticicia sp. C21]|uniref:hypothetical protein n=1 Tax=Emticicia sp. C21 TaxID=2302915 RepID=UPI001E44C082|nr:hypothetical protein [Emticicia sp. C21]